MSGCSIEKCHVFSYDEWLNVWQKVEKLKMRKSFVHYFIVSFCAILALIATSGSAIHANSKTHHAPAHHSQAHHQKSHGKHYRNLKKHTARNNRKRGVYMARAHHAGTCRATSASRKHWSQRTVYYARKNGIPPSMFLAQIKRESGFRPCAIGPSGAVGIAQIHPRTARTWKVNPHNPEASLNVSAQHMAASINRYRRKGVSQKRAERLALHKYGTI